MTKRIIQLIYILFAACLLPACQTDWNEPDASAASGREEVTLTVGTSETVASGVTATRACDNDATTVFEVDDRVGLTILDAAGNLLADNVPYRFNGNNWEFDSIQAGAEGKPRVYYDGTMTSYIVYYPYDVSVDGVSDALAIKNLPVFARREDQSTKDAYRYSDLMVCCSTGEDLRHINANLKHVRNSLSLDIRLRWSLELPDNDTIDYQPLKEALELFRIRYKDDSPILNDAIDITYHAEDGTYRYILSDDYEGKISWRYTYRGESFGGECTVAALDADADTGTRYVQATYAYIGESYGEKMEMFDYYCSRKINGRVYGYAIPWDAEKIFRDHHIIGIVINAGHHIEDISSYSESGIGQATCHGYVVALTDIHMNYLPWSARGSAGENKTVGTVSSLSDWSGYYNLHAMKEFAGDDASFESDFPIAYACTTYGITMEQFADPVNTTGWFLPTISMLLTMGKHDARIHSCLDIIRKYLPDDCSYKDKISYLTSYIEGYWSSSEWFTDKAYYIRSNSYDMNLKTAAKNARPFLAF